MCGLSNKRLRGAVGILVGYALALQLLLAGAVASRMALADPANPFEFCRSGSVDHVPSDDSGKSSGIIVHQKCVVCALAGYAPPLTDAPSEPTFDAALFSHEPWPVAPLTPSSDERHHPRSSQGPPTAA